MTPTKTKKKARASLLERKRQQKASKQKKAQEDGGQPPTPKMLAAGDKLERNLQQLSESPDPPLEKMKAAREALECSIERLRLESRNRWQRSRAKKLYAKLIFEDRYIADRQKLRQTRAYEPLACVCKIDRVVETAAKIDIAAIGAIPGYQLGKEGPIWNQSYRKATPIRGTGSIHKVAVESNPSKTCYPPYRVVIYPKDETGAHPQDLALILKHLKEPRIQLIEVAFDFPYDSMVDTEFVEKSGVFGKSKPRWVGKTVGYDSWGSRKGSKLVKSYFKPGISAHRVELEFHGPDLRKYGITEVFRFQKFAALLPDHHIFFGQINHAALVHRLVSSGFSADRIADIRHKVRNLEWNLTAALNYLTQEVGWDNVTRLLTPLEDMNRVVREAINKWAAKWRIASRSPDKKS